MVDEIYYDDAGGCWTAKLWSDNGIHPEIADINIPNEIEAGLDQTKTYECDGDERDGEYWVKAVGEVISERE